MAITVTTRGGKGSALTPQEMDTNLTNLARSASTSQEGNIEIATQAEVNAGTDSTRCVTPSTLETKLTVAGVWTDVRFWESGEIPIPASNSTVTVEHTLEAKPKFAQLWMRCVVADNGYSVGEELMVPDTPSDSDGNALANRGCSLSYDEDNFYLIHSYIQFANKSNRSSVNTYNYANWRLLIKAFV